ncbi:benzoate/H(+) symporter BenE family transporter [Paludibacterium yongneupense]|uniref:benzoate/H(+) symporter BenE family transporter n=1 Tax=Paludibacterium yongneupense TaxID=400061 RepID=UPI0003FB0A9E|nr:benzoate/H(+) symporter BenE family transporter [Paludibacterium yongneupense]
MPLWRDFSFSASLSALLAVLVSYSGPFLIVIHAGEVARLSPAQLASWVGAISLAAGVAGILLSWRLRMPVITAWSTPGAALLLASLPSVPYREAIGAFCLAGLLITGIGASGAFDRLMRVFPSSLAAAMLAGILFRFVAQAVGAAGQEHALVLPMLLVFLLARRLLPRYALLLTLFAGGGAAWGLGLFQPVAAAMPSSGLVLTWPEFSWHATLNLALPLTLLALTGQFLPGMAVLNAFGYRPSARAPVTTLGVASLLSAPFGGHGVTLAAIIAAICTGPEAHADMRRRYVAGVVCGALTCCVGLAGGALTGFILSLPRILVVAAAGLAVFGTLASSLSAALADEKGREAALLTFMVAASNLDIAGLGAPLWALAAGGLASALLQGRLRLAKPPETDWRG